MIKLISESYIPMPFYRKINFVLYIYVYNIHIKYVTLLNINPLLHEF